jgi:hypothetical protein
MVIFYTMQMVKRRKALHLEIGIPAPFLYDVFDFLYGLVAIKQAGTLRDCFSRTRN